MAKRKHTVSLSFILLRFVAGMFVTMLVCFMAWSFGMTILEQHGIIDSGSEINHQVEAILGTSDGKFTEPDERFPGEYALYDAKGNVLKTNVERTTAEDREKFSNVSGYAAHLSRRTYADGSTAVIRWHFRKEFTDPSLRRKLPPADTLGLLLLGAGLLLSLLLHTMWLGKFLGKKLKLFQEVSKKVAAQELDFTVPHAGIREYDEALDAMEEMREALYQALTAQWAAQQQREAEIAALAHDLKTPLTLAGGNAELLLEEELPKDHERLLRKIMEATVRAKGYVASLLEASAGKEEVYEPTDLRGWFEKLQENALAAAEAKGVELIAENGLGGYWNMQQERLLRGIFNIVLNAVEYTPKGKTVYLEGKMTESGWQICVRDEGKGFDEEEMRHAAERLWRGEKSRRADGHHGLGLWSATQVIRAHEGELRLGNWEEGGEVLVRL
nr:HAMP domain-containing sensor histidine kinase [uncultured Faecalimonas sp.]